MLSNSVAKALELFGGDEAKETAILAGNFNKFFDCLNVACFSAGKLKRDPFKSPYRSSKDFRLTVWKMIYFYSNFIFFLLQWLKEKFLAYLEEWEESVRARKEHSPMEMNMMMLSPETLLGIRITGTFSACAVC